MTQSHLELHKNLSENVYCQTKSLFASEIEKKVPEKVVKVYIYDTFGLFDKRNKLMEGGSAVLGMSRMSRLCFPVFSKFALRISLINARP